MNEVINERRWTSKNEPDKLLIKVIADQHILEEFTNLLDEYFDIYHVSDMRNNEREGEGDTFHFVRIRKDWED